MAITLQMISPYIYKRFCVKDLGIKLNDQEVEDMIAMADMDGDGKIQYNEFVTVMFNKKNWIINQHLNLQSFSKSEILKTERDKLYVMVSIILAVISK